MRCAISSSVHAAILGAAAADRTREVCGLLFGAAEAITGWQPCANVAARPAEAFEIDPAALIAALRAERHGGLAVVGFYHSHPTGDLRPSAIDAASAEPDRRLWLIVSSSAAAAWRAVPQGALHGRFDPVALDITSVATMGALRHKAR